MESIKIPLPHSNLGPYNNYINITHELSSLKSNPTLDKLEETILKFIRRHGQCQQLFNLKQVFGCYSDVSSLIVFLCDLALKLPELFPDGHLLCLEKNKDQTVQFSRLEVACLVSHMLFCTILPNKELGDTHWGHFTGARAPTGPLTFIFWLTLETGPTQIYLQSLLLYFQDVMRMDKDKLQEKVSFRRLVTDTKSRSWDPVSSEAVLTNVELHLDGRIGDVEQVEVDFANQHVGFGTTGTQEELMLGPSPEFCIIVLFNEILDPNEAILMTGGRRYGDHSGYGRGSKFTGPFAASRDWNKRTIIAIDAIAHPRDQLGDVTMNREICKAWTGFNSVSGQRVGTGHWGCGAFGGDQNIKCLVQVIAASLAGVSLDFYCFGDRKFHSDFKGALKVLKDKTVGWLWEQISEFRSLNSGSHANILQFIGGKDSSAKKKGCLSGLSRASGRVQGAGWRTIKE